jgi:hypothetical protein
MSDQQPATSRWGCLLVVGIILLLPGVCSLLMLAQAGWVMHTVGLEQTSTPIM